jgi:hypothetical protein
MHIRLVSEESRVQLVELARTIDRKIATVPLNRRLRHLLLPEECA